MSETVLAWHFVGNTLRDGRPVPPDGEWLVHDGPIKPCDSGLHASERIIDALAYAPGSTICRVEMRGEIVRHDDDKLVGRERRILWRLDDERLLRDFARRCALDVIHLWDAPDIVRRYLETGDEAIRVAARAAADATAWAAADATAWAAADATAWAAADATAWAAARAAADATAWAAADATAWAAADATAWAAADATAWAAADATAWAAARAAAEAAARAAEWAAAEAAADATARNAQNARLTEMVEAAHAKIEDTRR